LLLIFFLRQKHDQPGAAPMITRGHPAVAAAATRRG
jgi:hypothetical protein